MSGAHCQCPAGLVSLLFYTYWRSSDLVFASKRGWHRTVVVIICKHLMADNAQIWRLLSFANRTGVGDAGLPVPTPTNHIIYDERTFVCCHLNQHVSRPFLYYWYRWTCARRLCPLLCELKRKKEEKRVYVRKAQLFFCISKRLEQKRKRTNYGGQPYFPFLLFYPGFPQMNYYFLPIEAIDRCPSSIGTVLKKDSKGEEHGKLVGVSHIFVNKEKTTRSPQFRALIQ